MRRSLAIELCNWLLARGAVLKVHDPAVKELPASWSNRVQRVAAPLEALDGASALIVATEWPQYKQILREEIAGLSPELVILDANRFVSHFMGIANVRYIAVGTPTV